MNFISIKNRKWKFGNMYKLAFGNIKNIYETKKPKPKTKKVFYFQVREPQHPSKGEGQGGGRILFLPGVALLNGAQHRGCKKSTRKPNFGTFGPIIIYILSRNVKP